MAGRRAVSLISVRVRALRPAIARHSSSTFQQGPVLHELSPSLLPPAAKAATPILSSLCADANFKSFELPAGADMSILSAVTTFGSLDGAIPFVSCPQPELGGKAVDSHPQGMGLSVDLDCGSGGPADSLVAQVIQLATAASRRSIVVRVNLKDSFGAKQPPRLGLIAKELTKAGAFADPLRISLSSATVGTARTHNYALALQAPPLF
jgi:hypothetical protein